MPKTPANKERRYIETLQRRHNYLKQEIDESTDPHHPRMNWLRAEESALRWALKELTEDDGEYSE